MSGFSVGSSSRCAICCMASWIRLSGSTVAAQSWNLATSSAHVSGSSGSPLGTSTRWCRRSAIAQDDLNDIWDRVIPVGFVLIGVRQAYTAHQRLGAGILHTGIRELRQAHLAVQERRGQAVLHAELPRQSRLRLVVDEKVAHARADVADNLTDVVGLQVVRVHQVEHSINGAVCLATRRVGFHADSRRDDLIRRTKILCNGLGDKLPFADEHIEEAKTAVKNMRIGREPPLS